MASIRVSQQAVTKYIRGNQQKPPASYHSYITSPSSCNPPPFPDAIWSLLRSKSLTLPYFLLAFGDALDELNGDDIIDTVSTLSATFAVMGVVAFVGGFFMVRKTTG